MRKLFFILCLSISPVLIFAQENADNQVYSMAVDLKLQDGNSAEDASSHKAQHQIVLGRPVTLTIKGVNFKAAVSFTLYNLQNENLALFTQSTISFINKGRWQMLSTVKSIPIKTDEKVLFFPMGVHKNGEKSNYNCMLEMEVSKYQQQPVSQE